MSGYKEGEKYLGAGQGHVARDKWIVMKEFLVSSQPYSVIISDEQVKRSYGKEPPGYSEDSWQWLYRFPNGLGASVVRLHLKPCRDEADRFGLETAVEVSIVQWKGDRWKPVLDTNRRVPETDLEPYLGMIRDIPPEDVSRLTKKG